MEGAEEIFEKDFRGIDRCEGTSYVIQPSREASYKKLCAGDDLYFPVRIRGHGII